MTQLNDFRVLITGATSGLGAAMASALVSGGARVMVTGRDQERTDAAAHTLGSAAIACQLDVRDVVDTKLVGCFLMAREIVPLMLRQGGGRIVNISMNEETMVRRGFVPYGPAGAGVEALSRIMAADLADTPVTVNILLPGGRGTRTGMVPDDAPNDVRARLLE